MAAPHELSFADALGVEDLGGDRFRGRYPGWNGYPRVFGGVVLAQAVSAAAATVDAPRAVHALHGLFLRPARPGDDAELVVERLRDGRSFSTRQVSSFVDGTETSRMLVSLATPEDGADYQLLSPEIPGPDGYERDERELPFELVEFANPTPDERGEFAWTRRAWLRSVARPSSSPGFQAAALAYASDMTSFAATPGASSPSDATADASLDHAMWFHRPSDLSGWHLFELTCVSVSSNRSTIRGTLHDGGGSLVASMAQELLVRPLGGQPIIRSEDRWSPEETRG